MKAFFKPLAWALSLMLLGTSCATVKKSSKAEVTTPTSYTTNMPAYIIYDANGNMVNFDDMMQDLEKRQVVLFGELHNDAISHWLEGLVLEHLYEVHDDQLTVGCEMWETDGQAQLDSLYAGDITREHYMKTAKMWPNAKTDYVFMLDYCLKRDIPFIATNIPRPIAGAIAKFGAKVFNNEASRKQLPAKLQKMLEPLPLPFKFDLEEKAYKDLLSMLPSDEEHLKKKAAGTLNPHDPMAKFLPSNMAKAQATKDATMAHNIVKYLTDDNKRYYHFHGEMHSGGNTAICYYLRQFRPEIDLGTISVIKVKDPLQFDAAKQGRSQYNIVIPKSMYTSY